MVSIVQPVQQQVSTNISEYHRIWRGRHEGWFVYYTDPFVVEHQPAPQFLTEHSMSNMLGSAIFHTIDPITAVLAGFVDPNDLVGYPEQFRAWLNLLPKGKS